MQLTSDAIHTGPPPVALARVLGALALRTLPKGRQVAHGGREYPAALAVRRRETWHIKRSAAVHRVQRQHHEHGARTCTRYSRLRPKLQVSHGRSGRRKRGASTETTHVIEGAHSGYSLGRLDVRDHGEYDSDNKGGQHGGVSSQWMGSAAVRGKRPSRIYAASQGIRACCTHVRVLDHDLLKKGLSAHVSGDIRGIWVVARECGIARDGAWEYAPSMDRLERGVKTRSASVNI